MQKQEMNVSVDPLRRLPFVIDFTGLAKPTIYRKMKEHTFPQSIKIGSRAVGWKQSDLDKWRDSLQHAA
jgi:prophage regulatory protein